MDARIDTADPARKPLPRPDVRSLRRPLGPVAIFGASNFPLAFSVAGGDTASALAAGNTVVVKAHAAHPATSEMAGAAIAAAAESCGLPAGVFSLLFDDGFAVGEALVRHPLVRAVGFTGSRAGGEALARLAAARPQPIPVFAEMGSVNPVLILPGALRERAEALAEGLHASFTMGTGQFCTNPGLVLLPGGPEGDAFAERLADRTRATPGGTMLTPRIASAYADGQERLRRLDARLLAEGNEATSAAAGRAALWQVDASAAIVHTALAEEVFGPSTLLVRYRDDRELGRLLDAIDGQLTATVHAGAGELADYADAAAPARGQGGPRRVRPVPDRCRGLPRDGARRSGAGDLGRPHHLGRDARDRALHAAERVPERTRGRPSAGAAGREPVRAEPAGERPAHVRAGRVRLIAP